MSLKSISVAAAIVTIAIASASPSSAQSTRNVGGNNVGGNNVGNVSPNNIGGGGGGYFNCINVMLAGSTKVSVCGNQYTAQLGNIVCSGFVSRSRGMYLNQAPCSMPGQNFLGGSLNCNGNYCNWNPSRAGRAQGFQPEYVSAWYN